MSIKTLIEEAMNKNTLGFEAALKEELHARINESLANWNVGITSIPRTEPFKLKKIVATSPRGKTYTYDDEDRAAHWHGKDTWEKMKAGVGGWKVDLDNKKPYLGEDVVNEAMKLHDYEWPASALHSGTDLGDHAYNAIRHGMHAYDALDHIYSAADSEGRKWINSNRDNLIDTFRSYGLRTEDVEQIDEVSGAKLGDYIVKSRADVTARKERGEKMRQEIIKQYPELKGISRPIDRKTWVRPKSQQLAVKKLTGQARVNATEKKED